MEDFGKTLVRHFNLQQKELNRAIKDLQNANPVETGPLQYRKLYQDHLRACAKLSLLGKALELWKETGNLQAYNSLMVMYMIAEDQKFKKIKKPSEEETYYRNAIISFKKTKIC